MNNFGAEEDKIIGERRDERSAIGVCTQHKSEQQQCGEDPCKPLDLYRQDEQHVDDFVRIESREGEEQGGDQHPVGKIAAEEKGSDRCADHPHDKIQGKPERTPRAFKTFADKPEKPEGQDDPKAECLRHKNVSD